MNSQNEIWNWNFSRFSIWFIHLVWKIEWLERIIKWKCRMNVIYLLRFFRSVFTIHKLGACVDDALLIKRSKRRTTLETWDMGLGTWQSKWFRCDLWICEFFEFRMWVSFQWYKIYGFAQLPMTTAYVRPVLCIVVLSVKCAHCTLNTGMQLTVVNRCFQ